MTVPPEAVTAAARPIFAAIDKALDNLPQPRTHSERDRWFMVSRVAYVAAAALLRAEGAAAERDRIIKGLDEATRWAFQDLLRGDEP